MDQEGNIYDLRGNFIGTTDDDGGTTAIEGVLPQNTSDMQSQQQLIDDANEDDVEFEEYWSLYV